MTAFKCARQRVARSDARDATKHSAGERGATACCGRRGSMACGMGCLACWLRCISGPKTGRGDRSDWGDAARQMLDYYDRCYDHELARHGEGDRRRLLGSHQLSGLSAEAAAQQLLASGCITALAG